MSYHAPGGNASEARDHLGIEGVQKRTVIERAHALAFGVKYAGFGSWNVSKNKTNRMGNAPGFTLALCTTHEISARSPALRMAAVAGRRGSMSPRGRLGRWACMSSKVGREGCERALAVAGRLRQTVVVACALKHLLQERGLAVQI
jgi:hypothetical protein